MMIHWYHHDVRTTVTLDEDVAAKIRERMAKTRRSFKDTLNEVVRAGRMEVGRQVPAELFHVKARPLGLRPGLSCDHVEELLDQLDGAGRR